MGSVNNIYTHSEIVPIARDIQNKKALVSDGVPNYPIKQDILTNPALLVNVFNACLREKIFPDKWKQPTMVLLPNNLPPKAIAYWPIYALDKIGKKFEKLIRNRIEESLESSNGLPTFQIGFRKT